MSMSLNRWTGQASLPQRRSAQGASLAAAFEYQIGANGTHTQNGASTTSASPAQRGQYNNPYSQHSQNSQNGQNGQNGQNSQSGQTHQNTHNTHNTQSGRTSQSGDDRRASQASYSNIHQTGLQSLSPRRRAAQLAGMNGYNASTDLPPPLYVRALYHYEADDPTSLSFQQGDIIQVITQLDSGWWDGVIEGTRGWFPSNYCSVIDPDDPNETASHSENEVTEDSGTEDDLEEGDDDDDVHTHDDDDGEGEGEGEGDDDSALGEGADASNEDETGFWIPQATPDGRLFYFNTRTGESSMELPLETPAANETGMPNLSHFRVPAQTRPPPEIMASGYQQEEDCDGSTSEAERDKSTSTSRTSRLSSSGAWSSADLVHRRSTANPSMSASQIGTTFAPLGTTATSFAVPPSGLASQLGTPRYFADDGASQTMTWAWLVENMRAAVDVYCQAIRTGDRADYVRRAEDISDHMRTLLAAGSGTTDNHSGNPSIISTNKALYPHFREMMSKFSKLVLSSHIAAADWPGPEAGFKCLQEADGVMNGVYGYVEVARQQRGEEIPRLLPGFVAGVTAAGHWQDNNIDSQSVADGNAFAGHKAEDGPRPALALDKASLRSIEDARLALLSCVKRLEDFLTLPETTVTPARQVAIGDSICSSAGAVIEQFRPWIDLIEAINLAPLGGIFQKSSLLDFTTQKQRAYDAIGELVAACQATTAPLPDEWAEVRGESLDTRLHGVRLACKQLESHVSQVNYSLQLLEPATALSQSIKKDHRLTDPGDLSQIVASRADQFRPRLADIGQSQSYTVGQPAPEIKGRRPGKDKARQFFGQVPPHLVTPQSAAPEGMFRIDERPWFLQPEHEGEVNFDYKTDPPQVRSGTVIGLVEQLTRHDRPDPAFNQTFLLTYRSFITAAELFLFLVKRFNMQPPPALNKEEMMMWEEKKQKPVRFRVVNILKTWLEHYWMESNDKDSQSLLERMNAFAKNTITNAQIPGAKPLTAVIDQRMRGQDISAKKLVLTLTGSPPAPVLPKNMKKMKFLDIDATEFARQLTIAESKLYGRIKPVECLEKIWEKRDSSESSDRAPSIQALILHSNQLTNWVAEMILNHSEVRKRVVVIKHFVTIADKARQLNNFSTLTAIVSALGTAPILRLNRTWTQVHTKTKDLLESMRTLIASTKNFTVYREALHAAQPPCIPFLGVYLTDLTFIEDGIASIVKNTELINFTKRVKTAEVIRDIQQYQNVPYTLTEVAELRDWIIDNMRTATDVHEMYNKSLQIEPREREEEKIARLLSESGFL